MCTIPNPGAIGRQGSDEFESCSEEKLWGRTGRTKRKEKKPILTGLVCEFTEIGRSKPEKTEGC